MVYSKIVLFRSVLTLVSIYILRNDQITEATHSIKNISKDEIGILETIEEFGRKISYRQWENSPTENVVLSTLSIGVLLNLLMLGTDGSTHQELIKAINYSEELEENFIHRTYGKILKHLQKTEMGIDIRIHLKLFVHDNFTILDSFKSIAEKFYFCDIEHIDFKGSPHSATGRINNWVSDKSEGKFKEIFSSSLSEDTKLVATNVIFFNGTWNDAFDKSLTHKGTFNTGTESISISMMLTKRFVPYIFDRKNVVELIALPYKNNHYSMIILKPANFKWNRKSLQDVEKKLHLNELKTLINKMEYTELEIKIPRMKLELEINLTEDLKALGISQIFDSGANFGRLTSKAGMYVSDIIHKAVLEVREEGTTAAAVASGKIQEKSLPLEFYLDKPSLIFIRDNKIGSLLFWTRVMKPEPLDK
ncbi:UNVERIFIED_CONTAM: hypothetical protein RMT77_004719 [Armadillidium vulgare]